MEIAVFVILALIVIAIFLTPTNRWARMTDNSVEPIEPNFPPSKRWSGSPHSSSSPQQRIEELEAQVERLRASGRTIIAQREEWKGRALSAEAKLVQADGKEMDDDPGRYAALKRYLAKQFHPDNTHGSGIEKIVRGEIFKEVWKEIDRLDHQN